MELYQWLPPEAAKILLVLFLSFLIGLEREEHKLAAGSYSFGGVRTFPLIGLIGYSIALLSGAQFLPGDLRFPGGRRFSACCPTGTSFRAPKLPASPRRCLDWRLTWWARSSTTTTSGSPPR